MALDLFGVLNFGHFWSFVPFPLPAIVCYPVIMDELPSCERPTVQNNLGWFFLFHDPLKSFPLLQGANGWQGEIFSPS